MLLLPRIAFCGSTWNDAFVWWSLLPYGAGKRLQLKERKLPTLLYYCRCVCRHCSCFILLVFFLLHPTAHCIVHRPFIVSVSDVKSLQAAAGAATPLLRICLPMEALARKRYRKWHLHKNARPDTPRQPMASICHCRCLRWLLLAVFLLSQVRVSLAGWPARLAKRFGASRSLNDAMLLNQCQRTTTAESMEVAARTAAVRKTSSAVGRLVWLLVLLSSLGVVGSRHLAIPAFFSPFLPQRLLLLPPIQATAAALLMLPYGFLLAGCTFCFGRCFR